MVQLVMTSSTKITSGLLGPAPLKFYNEELEKLMAGSLLLNLQIHKPKVSILGGSFEIEQWTYEKGLVAFALKERISFFNPAWRERAVCEAAKVHILEQAGKRNRGRPSGESKHRTVGLLGSRRTTELDLVNARRDDLASRGKTVSDAEIIRHIVMETKYKGTLPNSEAGMRNRSPTILIGWICETSILKWTVPAVMRVFGNSCSWNS